MYVTMKNIFGDCVPLIEVMTTFYRFWISWKFIPFEFLAANSAADGDECGINDIDSPPIFIIC